MTLNVKRPLNFHTQGVVSERIGTMPFPYTEPTRFMSTFTVHIFDQPRGPPSLGWGASTIPPLSLSRVPTHQAQRTNPWR